MTLLTVEKLVWIIYGSLFWMRQVSKVSFGYFSLFPLSFSHISYRFSHFCSLFLSIFSPSLIFPFFPLFLFPLFSHVLFSSLFSHFIPSLLFPKISPISNETNHCVNETLQIAC